MPTLSCSMCTGLSDANTGSLRPSFFDVTVPPSAIYKGAVDVEQLTSAIREKLRSVVVGVFEMKVRPAHFLEVINEEEWKRWRSKQFIPGYSPVYASQLILDASTNSFIRVISSKDIWKARTARADESTLIVRAVALATTFGLAVWLEPKKPESMKIIAKMYTGQKFNLAVNPTSTVSEVISRIDWLTDTPYDELRLILDGHRPSENDTIQGLGLEGGEQVDMMLRMCGGMYHETSGRDGNFNVLSDPDIRILSLTVVSSPAELIAQLGTISRKPEPKQVELRLKDTMKDVVCRALFVEGGENASAAGLATAGAGAVIYGASTSEFDAGMPTETDTETETETEVIWNDDKQVKIMLAFELKLTRSRDVRHQLRTADRNKRECFAIRTGVEGQVLKHFEMAVNADNLGKLRRAAVKFPVFGLCVRL